MHRFLLHNDEIREAGEKVVSPGQVGLLAGWGVFSTIRVYQGVLFAYERHYARMKRDAARLHVPFPEDSAWLERRLLELVEANQAPNSTLRVVVVRNRGGMWEGPGIDRDFDLIAFTAEVRVWGAGVRLGLVPHGRHAASPFAGAKILSWSQNLTLYEEAHERGFDEVVLLNERGEVAECTSANIFVAEGEHVWTPPLSSGCLPGITRGLLLQEVREPGLTFGERVLYPADLENADRVYITSTTRELLPVLEIEGLQVKHQGDAGAHVQSAFAAYVEEYVRRKRTAPALR